MFILVLLSLCSDILSLFFHLSGLQIRKFPTSNTYMDDPFSLSVTEREQPVYSNTSMLEHQVRSAQTFSTFCTARTDVVGLDSERVCCDCSSAAGGIQVAAARCRPKTL